MATLAINVAFITTSRDRCAGSGGLRRQFHFPQQRASSSAYWLTRARSTLHIRSDLIQAPSEHRRQIWLNPALDEYREFRHSLPLGSLRRKSE
jgi:hypothetical protein